MNVHQVHVVLAWAWLVGPVLLAWLVIGFIIGMGLHR